MCKIRFRSQIFKLYLVNYIFRKLFRKTKRGQILPSPHQPVWAKDSEIDGRNEFSDTNLEALKRKKRWCSEKMKGKDYKTTTDR